MSEYRRNGPISEAEGELLQDDRKSGSFCRSYKAKPALALHTRPKIATVTGTLQATAAHMSRAACIQYAFGLGFARAKAPEQLRGRRPPKIE